MAKRKSNIVRSLERYGGRYVATIEDANGNQIERLFIFYSKKEVVAKLRNEYDAVVPKSVL